MPIERVQNFQWYAFTQLSSWSRLHPDAPVGRDFRRCTSTEPLAVYQSRHCIHRWCCCTDQDLCWCNSRPCLFRPHCTSGYHWRMLPNHHAWWRPLCWRTCLCLFLRHRFSLLCANSVASPSLSCWSCALVADAEGSCTRSSASCGIRLSLSGASRSGTSCSDPTCWTPKSACYGSHTLAKLRGVLCQWTRFILTGSWTYSKQGPPPFYNQEWCWRSHPHSWHLTA